MATSISHSPEETQQLGRALGDDARAGLVIGLSGDLGTGKTQFVKGIAQGLGVTERIHSPTFGLINIYSTGRLPLFHIDLYRLNNAGEVIDAGLAGYLYSPAGVTVVEWIDKWLAERETAMRLVKIEYLSELERRITMSEQGAA